MIPDFYDTSSTQSKNMWEYMRSRWALYSRYFHREIFEDKSADGEDAIKLYPVGINVVKLMCLAQADSLFGEWNESVVTFEPTATLDSDSLTENAAEYIQTILRENDVNKTFWEIALDMQVYGGSVVKVSPDLQKPGFIKLTRIMLENFYPIWDPEDEDRLLSVFVEYEITKEQARLKYGYNTTKDTVTRKEFWSETEYSNSIDGVVMQKYSGSNPWGVVPFVYIPRMRSRYWWGDALTEDLMDTQDELNIKVADIGDSISYNSHPIRWGKNLPKSFNTRNFPIGSNILWDLGKTMPGTPEPEVGQLESKTPVPHGTLEYVNFVYDWSRTASFAPPIAFGEDNGGGQRSGVTLEIRLWPLIKSIKRTRSYMTSGLKRIIKIAGTILAQKELAPKHVTKRMIDGTLVPTYAPILPRDQAALVDEVVKRLSTDPKTISVETAVKKLGDGISEIEKIRNQAKDDSLYRKVEKPDSFQEEETEEITKDKEK